MQVSDMWNYIHKEKNGGCWLWTAGKTTTGYGSVFIDKKCKKVHRVIWEHFNGPIPNKMNICHKCDVPLCCNPNHLFLGTQKENLEDMTRKGRRAKPVHRLQNGEKNPNSKLNNSQVVRIKGFLSSGKISQGSIAKMFGVSRSLVTLINTGKIWKEIL